MRVGSVDLMKFKDFVSKLVAIFNKDTIIEDIRITRGELEKLQASYSFAADLARSWKFKDETISGMVSDFKRSVSGPDNGNPIVHIAHHLKTVQENLNTAEKLVQANLSGQVSSLGLTYKQAAVLQYVNAIYLVSKYGRKWLNMIFVYESARYEESGTVIEDSITKDERKWLEETFSDFLVAYGTAIGDVATVMKKLNEVPEITVSESNENNLNSTVGLNKLDPMKAGIIATKANPIYFVRMVIAEWQVARFNESKEELRLIELRLQLMKELQAKRPNAKLEKTIAQCESRVQAMQATVAELEGA